MQGISKPGAISELHSNVTEPAARSSLNCTLKAVPCPQDSSNQGSLQELRRLQLERDGLLAHGAYAGSDHIIVQLQKEIARHAAALQQV